MPRVSMSALEQGVDYPEWANESTLQTLVAAVSGLQRTSKDESDESQRHTTKSTNKLIRAIEGTSGRMGSGFGGFIEALWNPLKSYSMNFARLIRNLDQLDGSFNSLSNIMFDNNGIIGSATAMMDQYVKRVRDLANVGLGLNAQMITLAHSSADAGLTIDNFSRIITSNGLTIRTLGDSALESAQRFGKLSQQVQLNLGRMGMFGMRQDEVNDLLLGQIEIARLRGLRDEQAATAARDALARMAAEATAMAEITGRDRREILLAQQEVQGRVDLQTFLSQIGATQGQDVANDMNRRFGEMTRILVSTYGEEGGRDMMEQLTRAAIGGSTAFMDDSFRQMMSMSGTTEMFESIVDSLLTGGQDGFDAIQPLNQQMRAYRKEMPMTIALQDESLQMFMSLAGAQRDFTKAQYDAQLAQTFQVDETTKTLLVSENAIRRIVSRLSAFGFETVGAAEGFVRNFFTELNADGIDGTTISDMILNSPEQMNAYLSKVFDNMGLKREDIEGAGTTLGQSEFIQALLGDFSNDPALRNEARVGPAVNPTAKFEESVGTFNTAVEKLSNTVNDWIDYFMDFFGSTDPNRMQDTLNTLDITNQRLISYVDKSMQDGTKTRLLNVADKHTSTS